MVDLHEKGFIVADPLTEHAPFDPDRFGKSIPIRIDDPKNNQTKGIHFAEDFKQVP